MIEVTLHLEISSLISLRLVSPRPDFASPALDSFDLVVFLSRHHPASPRPSPAIAEAEYPLLPGAWRHQELLEEHSVALPAVGPSKAAWYVTSRRPLPNTLATQGLLMEGSKLNLGNSHARKECTVVPLAIVVRRRR